jgi:hypothetical protein
VHTVRVSSLKVGTDDEGRAELDSHADTTVIGDSTALVIQDFNRPVRVHGYDQSVAQRDSCKTVTGVMAYDHPTTGVTYFLTFHQAILIPCMKVSLISPMQMRDNDLSMNDEPKSMALTPTDDHHCVTILQKEDVDGLKIPLSLHGVTSYFTTRKPTRQEYEQSDLDLRIDMTYESPEWDPSDERFAKAEQAIANDDGQLYDVAAKPSQLVLSALTSSHEVRPEAFSRTIQNNVRVHFKHCNVKSVNLRKGLPAVGPKTLAKRWKIGLDTARRTLDATTQLSI